MNKKILLTLAFLVVAGVLAVYKARWDEQTQTENIKKFLDFQTQILNKNIEEEKLSAMTVAALLAQNEHVKKCMSQNDRRMCLETLGEFTKTLSKVPIYQNAKFHIHTPEMRSFARSWIPMYNDDLTNFRHLLAEAKNGVAAGIEVGRAGVFIRSVAPIFEDKKMLGSIEVLLDFKHLSDFFSQQGLDLFVLLDAGGDLPYQNSSDEGIIEGFHFVNKSYANLNVLPMLKDIKFKSGGFYQTDSHAFTVQPMNDAKGERVGYFVIYFNSDSKERNLAKLSVWFD
ncbi:chemotaxis protein [Campylobacter sp. Marseille-Q3452]|uniref:Chemotaxis protein n=1 Tax=Campylobacter massiliensis TaxID=2762557 RepID=A0A842J2M0_9BACT|nr:cache domain-containing protein [Campylobacter massiliensis]MBC2882017.1 chemotaxis protein [Campylobacter massiliensis]